MDDLMSGYEVKSRHCMVDLETVDNKPTSAIASIGAVMFDEKGTYQEFYMVVDHHSAIALGMTKSQSTLDWWAGQSEEARKIFHPDTPKKDILVALIEFGAWFRNYNGLYLWGNGADFDNAILSTAYGLADITQPWKYSNNRCFRTVKHKGRMKARTGVYHNALDDAITQARYMIEFNLVPEI